MPYTDILIAASALKEEATVVHADTHFDLISTQVGLQVESFVQAIRKQGTENRSQRTENRG